MDARVALVALLCRTSDRTPAGSRGAALLAERLAEHTDAPARMIGSTGDCHPGRWEDDLAAARGCLLEAGGQVEDALADGRTPVLCASDCSICMTTLPTVARLVPGAVVVWLDAHADFTTPATTTSGFLGGMCLAGACGLWDTGFPGRVEPGSVVMVGSRDLERPEVVELEARGVRRLDALGDVVDAVDGRDVFVHVDLDVLDPDDWPCVQFPAEGGLAPSGLRRMLDEIGQAAGTIVGLEVTSFDAPAERAEADRLAVRAADAVLPLLPIG